MNDYPNIEIINFDIINADEINSDCPNLYENDMYNYIIDKFNPEYCYINTDSALKSLPPTSLNYTQNDSLSSCYSEPISCYTENIQNNQNLSIIDDEKEDNSDKSFYSYDNRIEIKFSKLNCNKKVKSFACTECYKVYKSKENLTLHYKNIHLKQKPYSCKYCSALFSHRNGKTYHERKFHTKYLPHKCGINDCPAKFASKSALNYHIKSQHGSGKRFIKSKFETNDTLF